jgi:hypothetical protein
VLLREVKRSVCVLEGGQRLRFEHFAIAQAHGNGANLWEWMNLDCAPEALERSLRTAFVRPPPALPRILRLRSGRARPRCGT